MSEASLCTTIEMKVIQMKENSSQSPPNQRYSVTKGNVKGGRSWNDDSTKLVHVRGYGSFIPDSGLVMDSKEGGPEESEEVEDGAGEGGWDSHFSGTPLPRHLAKFQATAGVFPLGRDPFDDIKS